MDNFVESRHLLLFNFFFSFHFFWVFFLISIFKFMHISFWHADHNEVSKDVEEEDRHADEEEGGDIRVDKRWKFSSD